MKDEAELVRKEDRTNGNKIKRVCRSPQSCLLYTSFKLKNVTFDADYYHIHFDNSYSSTTNLTNGEPIFFVQPSSITEGLEGCLLYTS